MCKIRTRLLVNILVDFLPVVAVIADFLQYMQMGNKDFKVPICRWKSRIRSATRKRNWGSSRRSGLERKSSTPLSMASLKFLVPVRAVNRMK